MSNLKLFVLQNQAVNAVKLTFTKNDGLQKYSIVGAKRNRICLLQDFLYCKADSNYTKVFFADGTNEFISRTMGIVISELPEEFLLRPHNSYVVNVIHVRNLSCGFVVGNQNIKIPVSRRRMKDTKAKMQMLQPI